MPRERIATAPTGRANRWSVKALETLTGTRVLTYDEIERYQAVTLDPGGAARNVDLPAEESCAGAYLLIVNAADAAEAITVRNDAAGTVTVIQQSESAAVFCDGTAWRALTGAVNS